MTNWFQSDECLIFYKSLDFLEAFDFDVRRDGIVKGRIVGYIQKDGGKLKQFFSRRATINGGPMLADDITALEVQTLLSKCVNGLKGKAIYVETRNFKDYSCRQNDFSSNGWIYEPHYDIHINCSEPSVMEDRIGKHRKKYIRLSIRDGAEIVECPSLKQVKDFYAILGELYRTKVKTQLWPWSFFEQLYNSPFGRYFLIEYNGAIVGGSACVESNDGTIYEWFACGKDGFYKNIHPSSLTKYAGMKYAADNGFCTFDLMGAGAPGDGGYGVRDFKLEFGGELVEYGRFKYILNPLLYYIGSLGVKVIKKLK